MAPPLADTHDLGHRPREGLRHARGARQRRVFGVGFEDPEVKRREDLKVGLRMLARYPGLTLVGCVAMSVAIMTRRSSENGRPGRGS